jgi:hypothetical protein
MRLCQKEGTPRTGEPLKHMGLRGGMQVQQVAEHQPVRGFQGVSAEFED